MYSLPTCLHSFPPFFLLSSFLPLPPSCFLLSHAFVPFLMPCLPWIFFSPLLTFPCQHSSTPTPSESQQPSLDSVFPLHSAASIFCFSSLISTLLERDVCTYSFLCIPQPTAICLSLPLNYSCQGHLFLNPVNISRLSLSRSLYCIWPCWTTISFLSFGFSDFFPVALLLVPTLPMTDMLLSPLFHPLLFFLICFVYFHGLNYQLNAD